jgi:hypothetical protein
MTSLRRRRVYIGIAVLVALGATLGTALDAIHTHFGATSYTHPILFRAAWWTPPLFAGAYASGIARPLLDRDPAPSGFKVGLGMALFIGAYWMTVAPLPWLVRAAVIAVLFVAGFWICDRTRSCLIVAGIAAVCGPAVEIALVRAGTFVHHEVHALGIPGWLPLLYATASPGLGTLAKWIVDGRPQFSTSPIETT